MKKQTFYNFLAGVLLLSSSACFAMDLGVYGKTYEITDIDFRLILMKQVSEIKLDPDEMEKDIRNQLGNMKYTVTIPPAEEVNIREIDMSTEITKDIQAKVTMPNGNVETIVLAKKGQVVNPFEYVQPTTKYLFFDPEDQVQKGLVKTILNSGLAEKYEIFFVVTGGDILKTADDIEAVYYAYPYIVKRFKIERNLSIALFNKKSFKANVIEIPKSITLEELENVLKNH